MSGNPKATRDTGVAAPERGRWTVSCGPWDAAAPGTVSAQVRLEGRPRAAHGGRGLRRETRLCSKFTSRGLPSGGGSALLCAEQAPAGSQPWPGRRAPADADAALT